MYNQRNHIHTAKELLLIIKDNEKTGILSTSELQALEYSQSYLKSFTMKNIGIERDFKNSPSKCMLENREYFFTHVQQEMHQENLRKNPIPLGPALAHTSRQR